ncbi:hypothetical protein EYZ11_003667 [Aspergillus tanneri]|uniref:Uncharacterized protein n=1 Tax=Aspergillus tanneri TaxID=1220188 RepID=A0A4S3JMS6_9EURO|nr:uncharacterized protein ATNIH1004_006705 [Aspergillus tanneri]KAA8645286.1 hypothetical protein ATNIH1004_006705 [Aspergillus tanneri]THC96843.1 hypothetical protein EYZ11_003667 [Aspergillus tanneri]
MSAYDGFVPVLVHITDDTDVHEVALIDENIGSFQQLASFLYQTLRPRIPDFYLPNGERRITEIFVVWQPSDIFPMETAVVDGNIRAVLRLLAARRGVDTIRSSSSYSEPGQAKDGVLTIREVLPQIWKAI